MISADDSRHFALESRLRNGSPVLIRAARPDDAERIANAFSQLDRETVYTRFFTFREELSAAEFARLDFVRDAMLVATVRRDGAEVVIAGASYHAHAERDGSLSAEVAFTVEEDFQGQGLAGQLIAVLATIARKAGIARFVAEVLPVNKPMLAVFARTGWPMAQRIEDGVVHVALDLGKAA